MYLFIPFSLTLFTTFASINCFQDCEHGNHEQKYYTPDFACEFDSNEDFTLQIVNLVKYNFILNECTFRQELAYISNKRIITADNTKKMHMFSAHSLIPDCLRSKSTYAGNNLWVIPTFGDDFRNINADTKERYKREAINIVSKICDKQKKIISAWPVSTPERRRNFLRDLVGSDNIDGEIKNGVVYIYSCTVIDPSDIIRSKKINDVCYDQVPVRVENKIYFSKNGIDLSTQSNVVSCPGTISWFPQLFQDKSLNIFAISLFVILTIWAIGIFITLVVCYGRKSPKNNGLNDTKNISVISHQDGRSETVNFVPTYMLIDPSVTKIASYTENGNNYEIDFDTSTLQSLHSNRMTNLEELKFIRPPPPRLPQPFQGLRRNDGMSSEASYI